MRIQDTARWMPRLGHELADRRPRALRLHQIHLRAARKRQDRKQEHEYAHAADPVREAAPEQRTVREHFHIGDNACARRGKAGDGFKQCIREATGSPRKRQRAGQPKILRHNPAEGDRDNTAFLAIKNAIRRGFLQRSSGTPSAAQISCGVADNESAVRLTDT